MTLTRIEARAIQDVLRQLLGLDVAVSEDATRAAAQLLADRSYVALDGAGVDGYAVAELWSSAPRRVLDPALGGLVARLQEREAEASVALDRDQTQTHYVGDSCPGGHVSGPMREPGQ